MKISIETLQSIGKRKPNKTMRDMVFAFNKWLPQYGITSSKNVIDWLANVGAETGGFRRLDENMNYSAKGLMRTWPSRFKTLSTAKRYARQPRKLANYVYGGRLGNLGQNTNDGWKYRGSGPGQITGRDNFKEVERETGLPVVSKPGLLRTADAGTQAFCIFWKNRNLNKLSDRNRVTDLRRKINGGTNGLKDVKTYRERGQAVIKQPLDYVDYDKTFPDSPAQPPLPDYAPTTPDKTGNPLSGRLTALFTVFAILAGAIASMWDWIVGLFN